MKYARPAAVILAALSLIIPTSCAKPPDPETKTEFTLGTVCSLTIYDSPKPQAFEAVFLRLREIEAKMSANREDSEIGKANALAGKSPAALSEDTLFVLGKALEYAEMSKGAFDPSVGPLVKLWGIGTESARLPSADEIDHALALVGYRDVLIDKAAKTVFLKREGMRLDLGAIAKGYAADEAKRILLLHGVKSAIIDFGGNIYAMGAKPGNKDWRIGVQNPGESRGTFLGIATLRDRTLVTSGVYERFFEQDGKRYHHILDTKTGYPVDNGLASTTIIAEVSIDADVLSTTLFILGREKAIETGERLKVDVIVVDSMNDVYVTPGTSKYFEITDKNFRYAE